MDLEIKDRFIHLWEKYFNNAELPIIFYYTNEDTRGKLMQATSTGHQCIIGTLNRVRNGQSLCFGADSFGCSGAKRYLGYTPGPFPQDFAYFLSCGLEGKIEVERYKKSPEIVRGLLSKAPQFTAPANFIVFKRWDMLEQDDDPDGVFFFAKGEVLSGLFTLSGFAESDPEGVIAPFAAGCASIVLYPYIESKNETPRSVVGMFDVSARPYVPKDVLSFATPMRKFKTMVDDMEASFLITKSWAKVQKRIS